jgi:hypothetical protein
VIGRLPMLYDGVCQRVVTIAENGRSMMTGNMLPLLNEHV